MAKEKKEHSKKVVDEKKVDEILDQVADPKSDATDKPIAIESETASTKELAFEKASKHDHKRFDKFKKGEK